jgi:energy-converting hydrogenase B subunit D
MILLNFLMIVFLLVTIVFIQRTKDLLNAVILYAVFSLVVSVIWLLLKTPDVALTEAAIGAGVTTVLFIAVLAKTKRFES